MEEKTGFLRVYLYIAILFGLLQLIDGIFSLFEVESSVMELFALATFFFFLFNLLVIPIFYHQNVKKLNYVLPLFQLISYVLLFIISLALIFVTIIVTWVWVALIIVSMVFAVFTISFSFYLLHYNNFENSSNNKPLSINKE